MKTLKIEDVQRIVEREGLLREVVSGSDWSYRLTDEEELSHEVTHVDYHSGRMCPGSLFICKGAAFKKAYLEEAVASGATHYLSETPYEDVDVPGLIVSDIQRAMALVARAFYGYPDEKMTVIGVTGTKGKTTTTYFLKSVLAEAFPGKVGHVSTIDYSVDGETGQESNLTTPESVDLFRMLGEAATNKLDYMVIEVSSQAYKMNRVYGLPFDIGLFANFSPDHIGPSEHPTMEDYFYCKRQLLHWSREVILYSNLPHLELLKAEARALLGHDATIYGESANADIELHPGTNQSAGAFDVNDHKRGATVQLVTPLPGDFNCENATAAYAVAQKLGLKDDVIRRGLKQARVPGRMMEYTLPNGARVYIDYAHNYDSMRRLLDYVESQYPERNVTVLFGATGSKGESRREGFAQALAHRDVKLMLTTDDPGYEDPRNIVEEILEHLKTIGSELPYEYVEDRDRAVEKILNESGSNDVLVMAGKGEDKFQLVRGEYQPLIGDVQLVEQFIAKHSAE